MARKPVKTTSRRTRKPAAVPTVSQTKQDMVLSMLRRASGASIAEIVDATDWQPHSVRGFFSGALKKRLKIEVVSSKDAKTGERRYRVAALKA